MTDAGAGRQVVHDPVEPARWWEYMSLEWHQRACTGMDIYDCYVYAFIDGDRLRVQHGNNPEAVRWFTLDELNRVGKRWNSGNVTQVWFDEIHRFYVEPVAQPPDRDGGIR